MTRIEKNNLFLLMESIICGDLIYTYKKHLSYQFTSIVICLCCIAQVIHETESI